MTATDRPSSAVTHLHRLIFLIDGVFAIAMTLLAIELHAPETWDGTMPTLMQAIGGKLVAYWVSFIVLAIYWISHRRAFLVLLKADLLFDVLTFLFLGLVALLPPVTSLLYAHASWASVQAYVTVVTAIGMAQALAWGHAAFVGRLVSPGMPMWRRLYVMLASGVLPGASCALSFVAIINHSIVAWLGVAALALVATVGGSLIGRQTRAEAAAAAGT